jgi:hypothetical protein
MAWTEGQRMLVPLWMVLQGIVGRKVQPALHIVYEVEWHEQRVPLLEPIYVGATVHSTTTRLTWHIRRGTELGRYLAENQHRQSDFLVEMIQVTWRLSEAEQMFKANLKPRFHRGDRIERQQAAIMVAKENAAAAEASQTPRRLPGRRRKTGLGPMWHKS